MSDDLRVLIVEDEPTLADTLQLAVETALDWTCEIADDGQEAWDKIQAEPVDIIISDWMMPRMDGAELCRRIRADTQMPYLYYIFETAHSGNRWLQEAMEAGADDYLSKPFDLTQLFARLYAAGRVIRVHRRLERLLRVTQEIAGESGPKALAKRLSDSAGPLFQGAVLRLFSWDPTRKELATDLRDAGGEDAAAMERLVTLGRSAAVGQAALMGSGDETLSTWRGMAAPMLSNGETVGVLTVGTTDTRVQFSPHDLTALELLARIVAGALAAMKQARLEGVLLAARTAEHALNNQLALTVGYSELLANHPGMPESLREISREAVRGAQEAANTVNRLRRVARLEETETDAPTGSVLDLGRAVSS